MKKQRVLKNGTVIRFIKSDGFIHKCFKPFEKAVWVDGKVSSQKHREHYYDEYFYMADKRIFGCLAPESELGEYFVIAKRAKKIRGKKRKAKSWGDNIWGL